MAKCVQKPSTKASKLEGMSEEQFDRWILSKMDVCQCLDCTTHNRCAKNTGERLYCVVMRSPFCIESKKGCLCRECPVAIEFGFKSRYHCLEGAEIERRPD
jgi:hypothetical protein